MKSSQALESSFECSHSVLRSNTEARDICSDQRWHFLESEMQAPCGQESFVQYRGMLSQPMQIHSLQITSQEICGQLYPRMHMHHDMTLCDHVKNQLHEGLREYFQSGK